MGFDTVHPITREGLAITNLFVAVLVLSAVVLLVVLLPLGDGGLEHPWLLAGCQLSSQAEAWSQGRGARTAEAAMHGPTLLLDSCRDADPARSTQRCSAQSASCSKTQPAVEHVSSACAFVVAFRKPGGCSAMSLPGDDASLVVPEVSCLQ